VNRISISPKLAAAVDIARPKYYNQDGTGRDGYIMSNNGGFTSPNYQKVAIDPRITFKQNLRIYKPDDTYLERRRLN